MNVIFDGRDFALKKEIELAKKVNLLNKKGNKPKLDSIIVGDDPASILYQNLKKKAAERIGAEIRIKTYQGSTTKKELIEEINRLNKYPSVKGIMVQLPLPSNFSRKDRREIIHSIVAEKDVDGLRSDSGFIPPTAKAVMEVLDEAVKVLPLNETAYKVTVVGASGFIGRQIVRELKKNDRYKVNKANSKTENLKSLTLDSDILISVTGKQDLIKRELVKKGAVLIDVGSPKGDIEKAAYDKASFVSPVPGGVGPVTISSLMENLVEATT